MNGDIGLYVKGPGDFDLTFEKGDLKTEDGLRTACLISLFSDRRVERDELPLGEQSLRGWWGDLFSDVAGDQLGSRLWLLAREKRTIETLNRAEDYSKEALTWLLDDGIADSLSVDAAYDASGAVVISITLTRPNVSGEVFRFQTKWQFEADQDQES